MGRGWGRGCAPLVGSVRPHGGSRGSGAGSAGFRGVLSEALSQQSHCQPGVPRGPHNPHCYRGGDRLSVGVGNRPNHGHTARGWRNGLCASAAGSGAWALGPASSRWQRGPALGIPSVVAQPNSRIGLYWMEEETKAQGA